MAKGKYSRDKADEDLFYIGLHLRGYKTMKVCGSYRRGVNTVGDLDIVVVSKPILSDEAILHNSIEEMATEVLASGSKLAHVVLPSGMQADFYIAPERLFESHTLFLTGSKYFNIICRSTAKKMGYRLSQYGLLDSDGTEIALTEQSILEALGMSKFLDPATRSL